MGGWFVECFAGGLVITPLFLVFRPTNPTRSCSLLQTTPTIIRFATHTNTMSSRELPPVKRRPPVDVNDRPGPRSRPSPAPSSGSSKRPRSDDFPAPTPKRTQPGSISRVELEDKMQTEHFEEKKSLLVDSDFAAEEEQLKREQEELARKHAELVRARERLRLEEERRREEAAERERQAIEERERREAEEKERLDAERRARQIQDEIELAASEREGDAGSVVRIKKEYDEDDCGGQETRVIDKGKGKVTVQSAMTVFQDATARAFRALAECDLIGLLEFFAEEINDEVDQLVEHVNLESDVESEYGPRGPSVVGVSKRRQTRGSKMVGKGF